MRTITALFALCAACSGSFGERPGTSLEPSSGPAPSIGACPVFPAGNDWNRDISGDPIDARSSAYMAHTGAGAVFDLRTGALRPDGWTSATASGLPEFAGLVRYEEATSGEIRHALAFTAGMAARAWVHPGTHYGNSLDSNAPPMATRVRLDASFDVTRYTGLTRTILVALQHYGMFLIDESTTAFVGVAGTKGS